MKHKKREEQGKPWFSCFFQIMAEGGFCCRLRCHIRDGKNLRFL